MSDKSKKRVNLRQLPSVEKILSLEQFKKLVQQHSHPITADAIRNTLSSFREKIKKGAKTPTLEEILENIQEKLKTENLYSTKPVINATGVILHTNLGRAPLDQKTAQYVCDIMLNYNNLEYDLTKGERTKRGLYLEKLLTQISSSQRALVVNNNASAVFLILASLAKGKEVVVSRGELVEIGGGFRLPEILKESGATLKEIGTTNKTSLFDYKKSINEKSALILKVHKSNFTMSGFVEEVTLKDLVELGKKSKLPVIEDLGSGTFLFTEDFGLGRQPTIREIVSTGVDLVCFSGDKLLGGPQAGIILGKKKYIDLLEKNPLYRVLRLDKIMISALENVIYLYLKEKAKEEIPIWKMMNTSLVELKLRGERIKAELNNSGMDILMEEDHSPIGGGSLPQQTLPTVVLSVKTSLSGESQAKRFRQQNPPIIGRIEKDKFLLDLRTVFPHQDENIIQSIKDIFIP